MKKVHLAHLNCDYDAIGKTLSMRLIATTPHSSNENRESKIQDFKNYTCNETMKPLLDKAINNAEFKGESTDGNSAYVYVKYGTKNVAMGEWTKENFVKEDGQWKYDGGGLIPQY